LSRRDDETFAHLQVSLDPGGLARFRRHHPGKGLEPD